MRYAIALAAVVMLAGAGEGRANSASDLVAKLRIDLSREPGSYVGCVPGGYLRAGMKPISAGQLEHVPAFDVDKRCRVETVCINVEQESYDTAKAV